MKRKSPDATGDAAPCKVLKVAPEDKPDHAASSSARGSSRQKKAPAWMAAYVIAGKKEEPPDESVKVKGQNVSKKTGSKPKKSPPESSLRRQSTLQLENEELQPEKSKNLKKNVPVKQTPSLSKKSTTILSSSDSGTSQPSKEKKGTADKKQKDTKVSSKTMKKVQTSSASKPTSKSVSDIISSLSQPETVLSSSPSSTENAPACPNEDKNSIFELSDATNGVTHSYSNNLPLQPVPSESEKPSMFEVVFCISTSGAMKDYLTDLQDRIRETVWRLQSIIPNVRIGVIAHTQGGIHDDKPEGNRSPVAEHSYIRTGGHSGTKWLDLGATLSQICAFVDSLGKFV